MYFIALYTTIPHVLVTEVLFKIVKFVFKPKARSCISFSKTSIY